MGDTMAVYSIWEAHYSSEHAAEGLAVTERIWRDMPGFAGYLDHQLLVDADDSGHLLVISRWASREHADASLRQYADHPNALAANRLASRPRQRTVATVADAIAADATSADAAPADVMPRG
jgi:quinol monooxygenase YgiN